MTVLSAVPAVIDALVSAATSALPDVSVSDGYSLADEYGDYLYVGVDDPDSVNPAQSADTQHAWAHANYTTHDQEGTITCAAHSWNGDADPKTARDAAYAIASTVAQILRDTPSLGIPTLLWARFGARESLSQGQGPGGASALVVFTIAFRARL